MMKFIINKRSSGNLPGHNISLKDVESSESVLFSLFNRFGDSLIALASIKEMMINHPHLKVTVATTKHFSPYVLTLLPQVHVIVISKRNPLDFFVKSCILKYNKYDLGFNPYSWSPESEYYISFCDKYSFFRDIVGDSYDFIENYYTKSKRYLQLPSNYGDCFSNRIVSGRYSHILICPESSERKRSLDPKSLANVIGAIKNKFSPSKITIAASHSQYLCFDGTDNFTFSKSKKCSQDFISLSQSADLMICVDSGPLHLAMLLDKPIIALFGGSLPETVINPKTKLVQVIHNDKLQNKYCLKKRCDNPECFWDILRDKSLLERNYMPSQLDRAKGYMDCQYK